ncbi:uncharacterized protein [Clytia hemisphaerica]|uniref:Cnidarian restricted protein n=1 Tax=Clytia hemisphaerica TaxID=252671 RepID=A0A7M5V5S2_9CNID
MEITVFMVYFVAVKLVYGSSYICTDKDCIEQNFACKNECTLKWITRILPTQASKPPGWIGIDCNACRGYLRSKNAMIKHHCKYGCQANGLKPPFFTKVTTRTPTPAPTRKTSKQTITKQSQNTKTIDKSQTTVATSTSPQGPSSSSLLTMFKRETIKNSKVDHISFLWVLCGILAACVILIGSVVLFTTIWKRLNVGMNNKIGISDVIIHKPSNQKKATVYVIT